MYHPCTNRYDGRMPYRKSGKWGLKLPAISLGFWHNFGDGDDPGEASRLMQKAFDAGVTHFDFANNYGPPPGAAERNCGGILKKDFAPYRDELIISTKAGYDMWPGPYGEWGSRKYLLSSLDQSLARLQLDYVDIFYSHRPDPETPLEETMGALASAVQQGKALYVGLSSYPLHMLSPAVELLDEMGTPCLIYQPPYSLLNRQVEQEGILQYLEEQGIGCIAFSPLAQGLLTDKYQNGVPEGSRAQRPEGFLNPEDIEQHKDQLGHLYNVSDLGNCSLQHLALQWLLSRPCITSALVGARTTVQLDDLLAALENPLSTELLNNL